MVNARVYGILDFLHEKRVSQLLHLEQTQLQILLAEFIVFAVFFTPLLQYTLQLSLHQTVCLYLTSILQKRFFLHGLLISLDKLVDCRFKARSMRYL